MKVIAVIGANFGDEGKGRIVDFLSASNFKPVVVVRYNGGAQAGHTVVTPKGQKHVFAHFGSGTFTGASTYLSPFFIANPILFEKEIRELLAQKIHITLLAHHLMPISTPYDMLLNREIEVQRGAKRHGSCGYGVSETIDRLCKNRYPIFLADLFSEDFFVNRVKQIRDDYVPTRLKELNIKNPSPEFVEAWKNSTLFDLYLKSSWLLKDSVNKQLPNSLLRYSTIIFEGSQGLGLDERHKFFPHTTRSKTGLDNITTLCKAIDIKELEVIYVTRAYTTRHGAGPFPTEDSSLSYPDDTNVENQWQGKLRFGVLDVDLLVENIVLDATRTSLKLQRRIAITCMDQVADKIKVKFQGKILELDRESLPELLRKATGIANILVSRSRSRK